MFSPTAQEDLRRRVVAAVESGISQKEVAEIFHVNPSSVSGWVSAFRRQGERALAAERDGILLISDKGFGTGPFERDLAGAGIDLLRPSHKREKQRYGEPMLKKVRQLIESVNDTLKGQLTSKNTVVRASRASRSGSRSASWPWPPRSGTTTRPASRSPGH